MVLERRHFLQMRQAAITIQVPQGPCNGSGSCLGPAQSLNACSTRRPAGGPTASDGHWRGHRPPCTSRLRGGAIGNGWPTGVVDRALSACRASAGVTFSARGEQSKATPPIPPPAPTLALNITQTLPETPPGQWSHQDFILGEGIWEGLSGVWPPGHTRPQRDVPGLVGSTCRRRPRSLLAGLGPCQGPPSLSPPTLGPLMKQLASGVEGSGC